MALGLLIILKRWVGIWYKAAGKARRIEDLAWVCCYSAQVDLRRKKNISAQDTFDNFLAPFSF